MTIDPKYSSRLPVASIAGEVNASLRRNPRLVVTAPPGSGKSTLLPLTILQDLPCGRIIMLEPRRAAARQIAMRLAEMIGEKPGMTVGYRMRFESRVSEATRIEVVTEGVMERMLVDDPTLDGIAAVIFDEFHERSLTADLSLALTIEAQRQLRDDLRIIIMSATIDAGEICRALSAPLIEAQGRMFEVEIIYGEDFDPRMCVPTVVSAVRRALREQTGDILTFLPGQGEIMRCAEMLRESAVDAEILPLYGLLSPQEQQRALDPGTGLRRRIVLATPIAETSLTIRGITTVVDSGLYRTMRYNPATGLGYLVTDCISVDMATQRSGRAGRLSEGVCYRLWSRAAEHRMAPCRKPEILDADLCGMMLDIAAWDGNRAENLPWLTPPPKGHITEAQRLLTMLGAIDDNGAITPHGRRMASLPCHPRIANMLVTAADDTLRALAADIAALLEEKDPLNDENDADINTRIDMLRLKRRQGCSGVWKRIESIAAQYRRMVRCSEDNGPVSPFDTGRLIACAYPERIAMQAPDGSFMLRSGGGESVSLGSGDDLAACGFLAIASMGRRVFLASPLSREDAAAMAVERTNVVWNSREKRVTARRELALGSLLIDSRPLDNPDRDEITAAICRAAAKEGLSMFDFSDKVQRLQLRIATVAAWHPEMNLPDVSTASLLSAADSWLPMYIGRAMTAQELKKIDMCAVIGGIVGYELMAEVDRTAPTHVKLPCGRNSRIDYRPGAELPVVSARLQDCFGLMDTPRLDAGKRPVLMELLSPGFKPVQLTQDLRGFWATTYFEVRKELRRRYPKHRWPDNPAEL